MGNGSFKKEKGSKTWSAQFSYKDYYGNTRRKHKRGFATKRKTCTQTCVIVQLLLKRI